MIKPRSDVREAGLQILSNFPQIFTNILKMCLKTIIFSMRIFHISSTLCNPPTINLFDFSNPFQYCAIGIKVSV